MSKKVLTEAEAKAKEDAKAKVAAEKAARTEELNTPLADAPVILPTPSESLLIEAEFTREAYEALDYEARKAFLVDRDAIDEDGNVVTEDYVMSDAGNVPDEDQSDASTSTEATGDIVQRPGSVDGDAEVTKKGSDGSVKEAINTAGPNAGEPDSAEKEPEGPTVQDPTDLDRPRTKADDEAHRKLLARDKRLPNSQDDFEALLVDVLDRLKAVERKLQVLDSDIEANKADMSTLRKKVLDKDTQAGSIETLGRIG